MFPYITEKIEPTERTIMDVWYELMGDAMGVSPQEAEKILRTTKQ